MFRGKVTRLGGKINYTLVVSSLKVSLSGGMVAGFQIPPCILTN